MLKCEAYKAFTEEVFTEKIPLSANDDIRIC